MLRRCISAEVLQGAFLATGARNAQSRPVCSSTDLTESIGTSTGALDPKGPELGRRQGWQKGHGKDIFPLPALRAGR